MKLLELLNYQNYQNYIQTDANNSLLKLDDDSEIDIKTEGVDKRNMNEEKGESGEHFLIIFFRTSYSSMRGGEKYNTNHTDVDICR